MPESLRPGLAGAMLKSVFDDIEEASKTGTLDEVDDLHISRTPMVVDKQGWSEVTDLLAEHARPRAGDPGARPRSGSPQGEEQGILSKVQLLHFKSPDAGSLRERTPRSTPTQKQPRPSSTAAGARPAPLRN